MKIILKIKNIIRFFFAKPLIIFQNKDFTAHIVPENNPLMLVDRTLVNFELKSIEGNQGIGDLVVYGYEGTFLCRGNVLCSAGTFKNVKIDLDRLDIHTAR